MSDKITIEINKDMLIKEAKVKKEKPAKIICKVDGELIEFKNEDKLKEAIEELTKNKTVIMIAHRLKTIRNADQILVLKDGEIVERGKHEELIKNNGLYSDLVNAKAKAESWKLMN